MTELLKRELLKSGRKAELVPIESLNKLLEDVETLRRDSSLNNYAKEVVNKYFDFELPKTKFEIKSIIVVATPSPIVKVDFFDRTQKYQFMIPPTYINMIKQHAIIEKDLNEFLNPLGKHALAAASLPRKLLAVRSGLAIYGRNNIAYVKDMGSFLSLETFYSDIPCNDENWHDLGVMELCRTCKACLNNCPTHAISAESRLVNTDICLTHLNEPDGTEFPAWLDSSVHNSLVGCLKCQLCCPMNRGYLNNTVELAQFSAEETHMLLENTPFEQLPDELVQKLEDLDMRNYYGALSRNLKALIWGRENELQARTADKES